MHAPATWYHEGLGEWGAMKYRVLGRTGIRVSEIGFGCGNVGGLMVRGSHEEQVEAVTRALELGIDYFDTAPSYGDGKSETSLGRVLEELSPDVTVATKVRIDAEDLDDILGAVERSLEASLAPPDGLRGRAPTPLPGGDGA